MYLHYEIKGEGPAMVMLHGAFVNSSIWNYQFHHFSLEYKVIRLDMRGHGHSDGSHLEEYSVSIFAEDVIRVIDGLGIQRAYFFGLSLGSMVTQNIAANYPERVLGLVLVGATASLRLTLPEKVVTTLIFPKWVAMMLFGALSTRNFMKVSFFLTWFIRGNRWLGSDQTRSVIRQSIAMVHHSELKKIYAAVHGFRMQNIRNGTYPVLIVSGEFDSMVIHQHNRFMCKWLGKRATQIRIAQSGHACNHDNPIAFNSAVEQWLRISLDQAQPLRSAIWHRA